MHSSFKPSPSLSLSKTERMANVTVQKPVSQFLVHPLVPALSVLYCRSGKDKHLKTDVQNPTFDLVEVNMPHLFS